MCDLTEFGSTPIERVKRALGALREARPVVVLDDADRENEADLVFAAEKTTPELINFMLKYCSGIICLCITQTLQKKLELPFMVTENESRYQTAFTVSIEARHGVTTGVSAQDRTTTIREAIKPSSTADDLVKPGHIFPLVAQDGGIHTRRGHTEASVDLARMANLDPYGVLCELMNTDGSMARTTDAIEFAREHDLIVLTIDDIASYRLQMGI